MEDNTSKAAYKLYYTRVRFLFCPYMSLAVLNFFLEKPKALAMGSAGKQEEEGKEREECKI